MTLGAQTAAAGDVSEARSAIGDGVSALESTLGAHASGITGEGMVLFLRCVDEWCAAYRTLEADYAHYADSLITVDRTTARTDDEVRGALALREAQERLASRLGALL